MKFSNMKSRFVARYGALHQHTHDRLSYRAVLVDAIFRYGYKSMEQARARFTKPIYHRLRHLTGFVNLSRSLMFWVAMAGGEGSH